MKNIHILWFFLASIAVMFGSDALAVFWFGVGIVDGISNAQASN